MRPNHSSPGEAHASYRNDIAAAHERIADLEQQLEQRRIESEANASQAAEPFLAPLKAQRDKLFADARKYRGFSADGLKLMPAAVLFFCGAPLCMAVFGTTSQSFVGKMLLALATLLTVMAAFAIREGAQNRARLDAVPIDEKIADIERTVAIALGAQRARASTDSRDAQHVRITLESDDVLAESEAEGEALTLARRG